MTNRKGFTLIEVLVALAVIAIVAGPLLHLFVTSTKVGRHSYDIDKANTVTIEAVEKVLQSLADAAPAGEEDGEIGENTFIDYYGHDWVLLPEGADFAGYAGFTLFTTVTSSEEERVLDTSFVPGLIDTGNDNAPYSIYADMSGVSGTFVVEFTEISGEYVIQILTANVLTKDPAGAEWAPFYKIAKSHVVSGVLPLIVINQGDNVPITLRVSNDSGLEAAIYIFDQEGSQISVVPIESSSPISFSRIAGSSLLFRVLTVEAELHRGYHDAKPAADSSSRITQYTTKAYEAVKQ